MWFTIPKNLLHIPTFAYYHQDIIVHIQVAHQFLMLAESDKNKYEMPETNVENLAYESKMINIVIGKVHQIYTDVTSDDIARYVRQILAEDEYHRMKPTEVAKEVLLSSLEVQLVKREGLHQKHLHLRTSVITSRIPKNKETKCFFVFFVLY